MFSWAVSFLLFFFFFFFFFVFFFVVKKLGSSLVFLACWSVFLSLCVGMKNLSHPKGKKS
jgi:hypothetical protein